MTTLLFHKRSFGSLACCITAAVVCAALTACSLNEQPKSQIEEQLGYTSAQTLYQNTVATLYNYIGGNTDGQGLQGTCRGVYDLQTFGSDEAMLPTRGGDWYDGGLWQAMYKHSWAAGHDLPKNAWIYLYKVITLCNRSLETLDANKQLLTDDQLLSYKAEVRALRAMYYWYLIDLFGRVPLITSTDVSMNEVQQSERADLFRFAVSELEASLPYLTDNNSTREGDYYGRITRPVCFFVLAKLMLNASVYNGIGSESAEAQGYYGKCIDYCNRLEALSYELETDYAANFIVYNETSKENIFTIPMDKNLYLNQQQNLYRSYHYRHAAAYGFTAENGSCATTRVLQVFGYDTPEQDRRFDLCYYAGTVTDLNGQTVLDRTGEPLVYRPWAVAIDISGTEYVETAGARMKKYEVDKNAPKDGKLMDNDIVLFRYADALLMRAEAKLRMGDDGQADFDLVRRRAGMEPRPCTLQNLLDERLLELCWEGWRRQDLIRFGQYKSLYTETDAIDESDGHTSVYPIPADVMALNTGLQQNPGY
ncbi:MAG: RagB/SusD family nutrient uptake outer membrane protein [Prevotella sp.]|nr:RagB/SusD family nutrient uptake outer membrane protein [Prevotella sp.]